MSWKNPRRRRHVMVVSDATGRTADMLVQAALAQFKGTDVETEIIPNVRDGDQLPALFRRASILEAVVIHTFVSQELRNRAQEESLNQGISTVDIMGPLLTRLSDLLEISPLAEPGSRLNRTYFDRIEAIEYTVKHDDGAGLGTIHLADIVLLGVSRASKTPLSIYLSYRGWKVANIPLVAGIDTPPELDGVSREKIVGLTVNPQILRMIRLERQKNLQAENLESYTEIKSIQEEVKHAMAVFRKYGCPVLDTSSKSIEESATEIMRLIYNRGRESKEGES